MGSYDELFIGVNSKDLPTLTSNGIEGADISTAAILGTFERGSAGVHKISDPSEFPTQFGGILQTAYGALIVKSFFDNLKSVSGNLLIKRMIPSDAVTASSTVQNLNSVNSWVLKAGRKGVADPGVWGNYLYHLWLKTYRDSTSLTAATVVGNNLSISVTYVAPFQVGDWLEIGNATPFTAKVLRVDELEGKIYLDTNVGTVKPIGESVKVVTRTLKIFKKDMKTGAMDLVETWPNLTPSVESADYIMERINNPDSGSDYIYMEKLTTVDDNTFNDFPKVAASDLMTLATQFAGGTQGTPLTTVQMAAEYADFNSYDFMYLSNTEAFSESVYEDGEAYCSALGKGIWVGCPTKNLTFAEAESWAQKRRRTRRVYAFNCGNWITYDDPTALNALKTRDIPNVGAIMGYAIFVTSTRGVHKAIASTKSSEALEGVRGVVGEFIDRGQHTRLATLGLNSITMVDGVACIRSARSPSKLPEFRFSNAIIMSVFFKKTFEGGFRDLENETGSVKLLEFIASSMTSYAQIFYDSSSNGGTEKGFASYLKPDGSQSGFRDVVKIVVLDPKLNPAKDTQAGVYKANFYFMPPAPMEKLLIGVGIVWNIT